MKHKFHRVQFAIGLRRLGEKPKRVVEILQSGNSLPGDERQFADFSRCGSDKARAAWDYASGVLEKCGRHGITALALGDSLYPRRLEALQENLSPVLGGYCPILYCKGEAGGLNADSAAAIVGTKEPSEFGRRRAREFGRVLATEGAVIVSGLALGCDTEGHRGCLEAKGCGVAVMAHGLDRVYPKANTDLAEALIAGGGCLVSEYAPGTPPYRQSFGFRDRIQAGLSQLVIVVETPEWDGTMITAKFARKQGKILACVAHPLHCVNHQPPKGNSLLLEQGAISLECPADAMSLLRFEEKGGREAHYGHGRTQLSIF
ncbi:MAG: DNA-processing protein DprA [Gammaproteobacteria bacterium]|nr:DNA-processing protein DprA [Gammaproteobacteria bacterium]